MNATIHVALGLMSGTSADGVDVALIRTDGEWHLEYLDALTVPFPAELQRRLTLLASRDVPLVEVLRLERELTEAHVAACQQLLAHATARDPRSISIVGFHGYTIRHLASQGLTWQMGDASLLSEQLGLPVVADFRRRDLAAGGQGAPLAALFHQHVLPSTTARPTAVLNLGGVANLTWLGPTGELLAGDTGPGCGLLDAWMAAKTNQSCDWHGQFALRGRVHEHIVAAALSADFFAQPFPKSADRYEFLVPGLETLGAEDGAATLCAITARSVAAASDLLPSPPQSLWVTGGGRHHPLLLNLLREQFPRVEPVEALGLRGDSLEAECFAWLAVRRLRGLPTSVPSTTGARRATIGGLLTSSADQELHARGDA